MPVDITSKGASVGAGDNTAAINAAIVAARQSGTYATMPAGVFKHAGLIEVDSVKFIGVGDASVLLATTVPNNAVSIKGNGAEVRSMKLQGAGGNRESAYERCGIMALRATNWVVDSVTIADTPAAGMHISACSDYVVSNNVLMNTRADSIHQSNLVGANTRGKVFGNLIINPGDDGVAVVSYNQGSSHSFIDIYGNAITDQQWGRGYTIVGGHDCKIYSNYYRNNKAKLAAIYIAAETGDFTTDTCYNILVKDNTIRDAGGDHGAIHLWPAGLPIHDVEITGNDIVSPRAACVGQTGGAPLSKINVHDNRGYGAGGSFVNASQPGAFSGANNGMAAISAYPGDKNPPIPVKGGVTPPPVVTPPVTPPVNPPVTPPASSDLFSIDSAKLTVSGAFAITGKASGKWVNIAAFEGGTKIGSDVQPANGAFRLSIPALSQGAHTIAVMAWSVPAGQPGGVSTAINVSVTVGAPPKRMATVRLNGKDMTSFEAPAGSDVTVVYSTVP